MLNEFSRTEMMVGQANMIELHNSKVVIFGIGGVGTFAAEALARSGVGHFVLIDDDKICLTNINRQLIATHKTIGQYKVEVMAQRILEINPRAKVETFPIFYLPGETQDLMSGASYVLDCIDTVSGKIALIQEAQAKNIPVISCMGAGNKYDPTRFEIADIYDTSVCPLCRAMRYELRKRDVKSLKVVYSREKPSRPFVSEQSACGIQCVCPPGTVRKCDHRNQVPGSLAFVPSVAGLIMAGEVIKDLVGGFQAVPQDA
jgi:tRNA A37 threonylcarbamoyladenosine dehydratase